MHVNSYIPRFNILGFAELIYWDLKLECCTVRIVEVFVMEILHSFTEILYGFG